MTRSNASPTAVPGTVPTTAMIFAAGLGLRMRPLTDTVPKPLLALAGRPILDHILDRVAAAGIETAVVNIHHLADQVAAFCARRAAPRIALSHEAELLETGGGVAKALPLLGPGPFYVINGDVLWLDGARDTLVRMADAWRDEDMDALLLLFPVIAAGDYRGPGDFFLDQIGRVRRRDAREVAPFVFTGIQILHPRLFTGDLPPRFSLNLLYDRAEAAGRLFGIVHDGDWFHIGTPRSLARVEAELSHGRNGPERE
jgi:MurNAc alpha-1-phosphate uridylyltransferase